MAGTVASIYFSIRFQLFKNVGAGLQVFYNLGELRSTVDGLINKYKSQGVKSVSVALDMKAISGGGGGFGGPGGIQRNGTP
ncbi:putative oligomeric Golgi complex subunit 5 protein [Helianthus anomalus]